MGLNKEQQRYVRLLYRLNAGSEEIIDEMIVTQIRPALSREVKSYIKILKRKDVLTLVKTIQETCEDV